MKPVHTFTVVPSLPPRLERLRELAHNLRWTWEHDTIELFRRLDSDLWETTGHNPVLMLGMINQAQLEAAAADEGFLAHLERVCREFDAYMTDKSTWCQRAHGPSEGPLVAYFSAEFGLTECFSIFAGGLGVLAGDHLKSASDLGVPLVGVSLLYQQGYFRQYLNEAGWQQEAYEDNDFHNLPLTLERRADGDKWSPSHSIGEAWVSSIGDHLSGDKRPPTLYPQPSPIESPGDLLSGAPVAVEVDYPGRRVVAQVWRAQVGRVPLYLLDTNVPANRPEDQDITDQLYGGDLEMRIKQEIMLGIGGFRALEALGIQPTVYHMNEGHSAFLALERIRRLMEAHNLSFAEAREAASAGLIFTTHTPVPAGHDHFPPELMDKYFAETYRALGLSRQEFLALGRHNPADEGEPFCVTVMALRLAAHSNGVSRLHGQVTRRRWRGLWPGVPEEEVPIGHVTNGIHFRSWISHEMDQLYDRYLGPRWREEPANREVWQRAERIPAEELWRTHERRRERLVAFVRRRLRAQLERRGAPLAEIEAADEALDPEALTIGFARRFATYKRATLLLRDPERLARILNNPDRPAQVIFAGKAHPRDDPGKELIRQVVQLSRREEFRWRLVFLEDYGMTVARYLVGGVDLWLNTPRRLDEACGTSGMKAVANGVLHMSVLDGWWDEAYDPKVGWAIGHGEVYENLDYQDQVESNAIYDLLERDVIPAFYDRGPDGLPRRWLARMKASIETLCHFFNTHRMVREYMERFYLPAAERYGRLSAEGMARAKELAAWKVRLRENWPQVRIEAVEATPLAELEVRARVRLGALLPEDVSVELYFGRVDAAGEIVEATPMHLVEAGEGGLRPESQPEGSYLFEAAAVPCRKSGLHGYTVRVLPRHPDLTTPFLPGLIVWA